MKKRSSFAFGFVALIFLGALLLSAPWSRTAGHWGDFSAALFTATSAVCVTGLTVVDIAAEYTPAGQITLICLVEIGCLGLIAFGTFLMIAIGRRLSLSSEFSLLNAYGVEQVHGLQGLIAWVIGSMLVIEGLGAAALYYRFHDWYLSLFYSVMGFCNAGFGILPGSLASFAADPYVLFVEAVLTLLGGIGFLVIYNLCTFWFLRRRSGGRGRISLHSRVVLRVSGYLLLIAFAAFLLLEWNGALAGFPLWQKLTVGFYQSVTPRTCGYCVIPTEALKPLTRLCYEVLMFIGGGPGSAAAGIKVTTLAVLLYTLRAMCRGESETVIARRVISNDTVRESIVIFMAVVALIVVTLGLLLFTESGNPAFFSASLPAGSVSGTDALFFEAVSAITTTGLSCGDTTRLLTPQGRLVIMVAMFTGRLGALSVVMLIGDRETVHHLRYPNEELVVG